MLSINTELSKVYAITYKCPIGVSQTQLTFDCFRHRFSQVRLAQNGNWLPSPRLIHTVLFPETDVFDFKHTLAVMEWGQIIAHDVTFLSVKKGPACCAADGSLIPPRNLPPVCLPIAVPSSDPFYSRFRKTCLDQRRASTSEDFGCRLIPVQQVSGVSHFLDGSVIYSSTKDTSNSLRLFRGGLLKSQITQDGRAFLMNTQRPTQVCNVPNDSEVCYVAGDGRVNQNTEIAVSQVMFMRLHNLLATELSRLNPNWSDEILFQEARRIVIAVLQHVTYNEYLPVLLGPSYVRNNNLVPLRTGSGYANGYNPNMNPSSLSEFVAAAFRSYHSTIQGSISLVSENRTLVNQISLSEWANRPGIIQAPGNFDNFLRGLISQPQHQQDIFFSSEITNFLFRFNGPFGVDLLSMDINRGRDFGIPPYSTMRLLCGLSPVNSFEDLRDVMEDEKIQRLSTIYSSVHDIDYLVGGLLEKRAPGTLTSPSFHCVIAEAFFRYKFADRFYYEFGGHPGAFTLEQLNSIRKFTYSMLLCLASDNLQFAQPSGFHRFDSQSNPLIPCSDITSVFNLRAWAA
ncbi:peroxidase-like isoform X2 [Planococcus citri]|uniref:peroxidase-like isoform X2 n=1 Tax=Planococcus citri TaxID=170843 RepID=UPI0031F945F7